MNNLLKKCSKCLLLKTTDKFDSAGMAKYPNLIRAACKSCTYKDKRAWALRNIEKVRKMAADCYRRHRKIRIRKAVNDKKLNPQKWFARYCVHQAIAKKILIRPKLCSVCNKIGKIEGHHNDYQKVLDVIWMCTSCHKSHHNTKNMV